ncbi:hypothetical protein BsWGS_11638 [Bradybaena similaris]
MEKIVNLEYRGEGNCAIVFADPQTNHVYRLVKYYATRKIRKLLQNGFSSGTHNDVKNIQSALKPKLERVVSYMTNVMNPLMTERYIVTPVLVKLPEGFAERAVQLVGQARPAYRKHSQYDAVDPDIPYALVLPDCCFVHHPDCGNLKYHTNSDNADDSFESPGPSDSEITSTESQKINQNNSFCSGDSQESSSDFHDDSIDINISTCADDGEESEPFISCQIDTEELDDLLPPAYVSSDRLNGRSLSSNSIYCRHERDSEQRRFIEDHGRQEIVRDGGQFTLSIEIKPKKAFMTKVTSSSPEIGQVCRFCMHQHLKRKSGMWPQTSSYCPLDLFSGNKQRMKHALFSLIKTPQNNLKICRDGREVYGSDIRMDLNSILQKWFHINSRWRHRLVSLFLDLVIEILLNTSSSTPTVESDVLRMHLPDISQQKCQSSSFVHDKEETAQGLPYGCVLERICSIQSLDDLDIEGAFPLYTRLKARLEQEPHLSSKWCLNGPYNDVTWLFGVKGEQLEDLDPDSDDYTALKIKRFLVSKTLQDCSIIVAIKPVLNSTQQTQDVIQFEGDCYEFSIKVVDLDPKPFEKVKTYYLLASDIASTFAETAFKTSQCEDSGSPR